MSYYLKAYFKKEEKVVLEEGKNCILLVSVGQSYHEGDKLKATIQLINNSNFNSCTIVLADSLQRHNLDLPSSENCLYKAIEHGDSWLERNKDIYSVLSIPYKIVRWQDCLNYDNYSYFYDKVKNEYHSNLEYKQAMDATINKFIERNLQKNPDIDTQKVFESCLTYLLEECPIIMPIWANQGVDYIIYPQPMTTAMSYTRKLFVQSTNESKAQWLSLRFKDKFLKETPQ